MTDQMRKLKVFLCHSENDRQVVEELFERLVSNGFDPWMESKKILPGENIKDAIEKAMNSCDVILLCISKFTLSVEGSFQQRMRLAMDIQTEKLPGSIFLVPTRLEDCEIPDHMQLHKIQSADYFLPDGFDRLVESLLMRAEELHLMYDRIASYNPNRESDDSSRFGVQSDLPADINDIVNKLAVLNMIEEKKVLNEKDAHLFDEARRRLLNQAISLNWRSTR